MRSYHFKPINDRLPLVTLKDFEDVRRRLRKGARGEQLRFYFLEEKDEAKKKKGRAKGFYGSYEIRGSRCRISRKI